MRVGSNEDGTLTLLDVMSVISFVVGLENLDLNITQENLDRQAADLKAYVDEDVKAALDEIHRHLAVQDEKLNILLRIFKDNGYVILDREV